MTGESGGTLVDTAGDVREQPVRPLRIRLVQSVLWRSGNTQLNLGLVRHWSRSGHDAEVIALHRLDDLSLAVPEGVRIDFLMDSPPGRFYLRWPLLVLRMLPKLRGADVVVAGSEIDNGLLVSWLAARLLRKPCVVIVHASPRYMMAQWSPRPLRAALRYVLPRCAGAVCVAPELETEMIELGARPERTVTVTNGIDIEDLRARAAQVPITPREHPVVVAVGRMVPQKGFDVLLRAHAQVVSDHPHRLRLVGEGRDAAQLEALAQELGVRDSVEFTGFLDDPVPAMADADVFCLSSRHEGFGLVAFEAQTIGLPVIATDCASAIHDLLGGGAYGDLLPPDDVDALAAALRAYLSDPATLQAKAAAGQAQSERYSLALTAARHAEALARVVGAAS